MHRKLGAVFVSWENSGIFSPDRPILIWEPHDEREQKISIDTPLGCISDVFIDLFLIVRLDIRKERGNCV
jgi:hypothetical protein